MTGQSNAASNVRMTFGARDAEAERINLRPARFVRSGLRPARARIAWCMVGTPLYQVALASSSQARK
jgi:hypothetical protein